MSQRNVESDYLNRILNEHPLEPLRDDDQRRIFAAWQRACQVRDFEIQSYWSRSTYFWGLQVVLFATLGLFFQGIVGSADKINSLNSSWHLLIWLAFFGLANVGLSASYVWSQMLVGAKFWQDNWERHIDLLEDFVTGPIYKTYLAQSRQLEGRNLNVVSVTKANQIVSELFVVFWGALCTILLLYQPLVSSFIDLNYHYILYMSLIFLYIFASAAIKMWLDRKLTSSVTAKVGDVFDNVTHNMATRGALTDADPNWQKQEK